MRTSPGRERHADIDRHEACGHRQGARHVDIARHEACGHRQGTRHVDLARARETCGHRQGNLKHQYDERRLPLDTWESDDIEIVYAHGCVDFTATLCGFHSGVALDEFVVYGDVDG
ncbi:hypothetical protein VNO80_13252 [Phaseolus coccineus]|uniref:Uncharacterized protein n=1 Tax=Phaseolus coccineus TaxID=3886 RepID=A0AAN9N5W5_PHACN